MKKNIKDSNSCRCATTSCQQIGGCGMGKSKVDGGGGKGGGIICNHCSLNMFLYISRLHSN